MLKDFSTIIERARGLGAAIMAIAVAEDAEVIEAVRGAADLGLARAILVGNRDKILSLAGSAGLPEGSRIVDEPSGPAAALEAARLVRSGEAGLLMKGAINTSDFLRAVLDPENGLRSGGLLSHMSALEIPGEPKLLFHSDCGMNIAPDLEDKKKILANALGALRRLGVAEPKVAILAANEQVSPKARATVDAKAIADAWKSGEFPHCVVEGPVAMDVATSAEAATRKGIQSAIAGETDLFIMPSLEAGNIAAKILMRYAGAWMAGLVLGATHPIVLVSRSDDADAKIHSIALACLIAGNR